MNKDDIKITPISECQIIDNTFNTIKISIDPNKNVKIQESNKVASYKNIGNKQYKKSQFIEQIKSSSMNFNSELYYKKLQSDYIRLKFLVNLVNYMKGKYLS